MNDKNRVIMYQIIMFNLISKIIQIKVFFDLFFVIENVKIGKYEVELEEISSDQKIISCGGKMFGG